MMTKALIFSLAMVCALAGTAGEAYRLIPIAKREHGYNNLDSTTILTKKDYLAFIDIVGLQDGWNGKEEFVKAMDNAKIDFDKEAVVFLRHTEGSGSVQVKFLKPKLSEEKVLICKIERKEPETGTADMAYYAFAVIVDRSRVKLVEFQSKGKQQFFKIVTPPKKK